jgi:S-adenosylmethionine synthetase
VYIDTFGTGTVSDAKLERAVQEVFDLRPGRLIADLKLQQPIYSATAAYGHFGRTPAKGTYDDLDLKPQRVERFTWEKTDRINELRTAVKA